MAPVLLLCSCRRQEAVQQCPGRARRRPRPSSCGSAPDAPASPDALPPPFSKQNLSLPVPKRRRARRLWTKKKPGEALSHFQREIALGPEGTRRVATTSAPLNRAAGRAARRSRHSRRRGRKGAAAVAADAAFNTGQTLYREKQYESAAAAFREALKRRPGDADAAWNYELCVRRAEEEKQKQKEQQKDKKDQKDEKQKTNGKDGKDKQQAGNDEQKKQQQEKEFEQKANMTRDKAEQLLSTIERSDLDEQKKKIAEQRSKRRVARDW